MKKQLLFVFTLVAQASFAQIISKDPTFASNGIHTLPAGSSYLGTGSTYAGELTAATTSVFYKSYNNSTNQLIISKATTYSGPLDLTFGTNGKIALNYNDGSLVGFLRHTDDKLTLLLKRYDSTNSTYYLDVVQLLSNGQLDPSFGNGGIKALANLSVSFELTNLIQQGNKILVSGISMDSFGQTDSKTHTLRLNSDGTLDNSFGNNGEILTYQQNPFQSSYLPRIILDNQFNLLFFGNGTIKKYTVDGQPMTGFGSNGEVLFSGEASIVKVDSADKIVYAKNDLSWQTPPVLGRLNADGTPDTTFNYNGIVGLEFRDIYEKNGSYYIAGYAELNNSGYTYYYISKLNQNGAIDPVFGEYIENDPNLIYHSINSIKVFDDNIMVSTDGETFNIVKYLINGTATLATKGIIKNNPEITFESPVEHHLKFKSKEKIDKIEIYSAGGKLIKTVIENKSDVSELSEGVYFAKAIFENGRFSTKKLIKK
ncbi:T9SS type A sorting domain-containing protein [Chryseobacterium sp. JV558]|uniref:T9SS type A sorting domain-containing protein n=1 Tax=Chryseobacterium sp. JV558 TaxID=2663236 RepID=UPI00299E9F89|nr:T9SS type A sorting domain-containing protein [Chryseobacterium sp. JV558]MDW9379247.1 T9SS type A sorting domain-containing protein [Chryseobacterium sp. JV558]